MLLLWAPPPHHRTTLCGVVVLSGGYNCSPLHHMWPCMLLPPPCHALNINQSVHPICYLLSGPLVYHVFSAFKALKSYHNCETTGLYCCINTAHCMVTGETAYFLECARAYIQVYLHKQDQRVSRTASSNDFSSCTSSDIFKNIYQIPNDG